MSSLAKAVATGNVVSGRGQLNSVILTPAAAVSTVDIRLDGSGGTVVASLQAAASGNSVIWRASDQQYGQAGAGVAFPGPLHVTLAGAGASVAVETS
jgi:hypothetical protein